MSWRDEYWRSIKSFDTEEKLDLYFYRPVGFVIAKAAKALSMTPDHLTYLGALCGLASGPYFAFRDSTPKLLLASLLLILAGLFDSSDGQLARMGGGKGSKFGLILDGICDNVVFTAVYVGSICGLLEIWEPLHIWPIGVVAGLLHSLESSALDYFNREYLYFGYGKVDSDYWNPTHADSVSEMKAATGIGKFLLWMRLSWIWQQNKLSTRSQATRQDWKRAVMGPRSAEFQELYRAHNCVMLRWWRLMGPNFHTAMILLFTFLRHFDWYLIGVDILLLPVALVLLRMWQLSLDARLIRALKETGIT
jgi:hypothetical protein